MRNLVHFVPILTTLLAVPFSVVLFRHWRRKPASLYLLWWTFGVVLYGIGTLTESITTLFGWNEATFRAWYISGALLGGAPLAQGTVYLLMKKRTADILSVCLLLVVAAGATFVLLSPIATEAIESHRLSGSVLSWQWVRLFSPFINTYALIFLVGGAAWSAWQYHRLGPIHRSRMWGNIYIALGALLPGIGGSFTRFGFVEVLYVTEILGLLLIWLGYEVIVRDRSRSIHMNQQSLAAASAPRSR